MRRLLLSLLLASTVLLHDVHGDDLVVSSTNLPSTIEMSTTEDVVTTTEMLSSVATSTELESTTMMSTVEASTTTDATTIELMTDATITTTEEPSSTINMAESTMQTEQMETTTEILSETTTEMTLETTSEMEAVTTTRDPIRKWNRLDLLEEYKKKTVPCNEVIEVPEDEPVGPCPEGWIHYMESCYLILKKYATMDQADEICQSYNTTLFVADHQDELKFIQDKAIEGYTWIGVFKKDELKTTWQAGCGMDIEALPWLLKSGEDHGWNELTRCAAMYNMADLHYTHFYPCSRFMNFICERNATLYM